MFLSVVSWTSWCVLSSNWSPFYVLSKGIRSLWGLVAQRIFVISFLNFMIGRSFFVTGQRGGIRRRYVKAHYSAASVFYWSYLAHPDQWRCQSVDKLWQWGHVPYFLRTMPRVLLHPFSNWCARMRHGLPETWSYNCLNCLNRLGATETMQKIVKKPAYETQNSLLSRRLRSPESYWAPRIASLLIIFEKGLNNTFDGLEP